MKKIWQKKQLSHKFVDKSKRRKSLIQSKKMNENDNVTTFYYIEIMK
jgi:hypothetical protein